MEVKKSTLGARLGLQSNNTINLIFMEVHRRTLRHWFSTFFDSRHPSFAIEQFGGTPSLNLPVNRRQTHKLAVPGEIFTAP